MTALEAFGGKRQKRVRSSNTVNFSMTLDYEDLERVIETQKTENTDRSSAIRLLIDEGFRYRYTIRPMRLAEIAKLTSDSTTTDSGKEGGGFADRPAEPAGVAKN